MSQCSHSSFSDKGKQLNELAAKISDGLMPDLLHEADGPSIDILICKKVTK